MPGPGPAGRGTTVVDFDRAASRPWSWTRRRPARRAFLPRRVARLGLDLARRPRTAPRVRRRPTDAAEGSGRARRDGRAGLRAAAARPRRRDLKSGEAVGTFLRRIGANRGVARARGAAGRARLRGELNRVLNAEWRTSSARSARPDASSAIDRLDADGRLASSRGAGRLAGDARRDAAELAGRRPRSLGAALGGRAHRPSSDRPPARLVRARPALWHDRADAPTSSSPPTGRCTPPRPMPAALAAPIAVARSGSPRVTRVICPPFVLRCATRCAVADPGVAVGAQNVHHEAAAAPSPARSSPPMLAGLRDLGDRRPLGAAARRGRDRRADRPQARAAPWTPACARSLCVGEQCRGARGGRSRDAVVERQLAARSPGTTGSLRAPAWSIAYEPVWAIGTGRRRDRRRRAAMAEADPRRCCRALGTVGRRRRPGPVRRQRHLANIAEFLAEPAIDGALVGGASLKPDEMAGIVAGRSSRGPRIGRVPAARDRSSSSCSTASASGATRPRDAIAAAPMPIWRGLLGAMAARRLGASEEAVGPARRADGQLRGRPPQPRRRPAGPPGPAADRRRDRRRLVLRAARRSSRPAPRAPSAAAAPHRQPDRPRRRPCQRPPPRRARRARRAAGVPDASASTRCSTAATRRRVGRLASSRTSRRGSRRSTRDARIATRRRPLLRDGPRHALGSDERGYDAIVHGDGTAARRPRSRPSRPATRAARTTSSSCRPSSTASTASSATAIRVILQLPRRPGAAADPRAGDGRTSTASIASAGRPAAACWSSR